MNDIIIIINESYQKKLIFNNLSFNMHYDIHNHKNGAKSGNLTIKSFFGDNIPKNLKTLKIKINNNILDISHFTKIIFYQKDLIEICYKNIFETHYKIISFINNSLEDNFYKESLICYSTQLACNLKCSYCSTNCYNYKVIKKPSYDISEEYLKEISNNLKISGYNFNNNVRYRIMGGETFLVPSIFEYSMSKMFKIHSDINNNLLYIYSNCLVDIKYVEEQLNKLSKKMKIIFIASVDSFNPKYSYRFESNSQIKKFQENLLYLNKIKNNNVIISVSIFINDNIEDIFKTLKWLEDNEIKNIKITFDERFTDNEFLEKKLNLINTLLESKFKHKFYTSKNMKEDFFVTNFVILENGEFLSSIRTVNRIGNCIHKIYKYNDLLSDFFINGRNNKLK